MEVFIDTAKVTMAAEHISGINQNMKSDFEEVNKAMKNLDRNWNSTSSDGSIYKFKTIQSQYVNARAQIVDNMIRFMKIQVAPGYEETETSVQSAVDVFR